MRAAKDKLDPLTKEVFASCLMAEAIQFSLGKTESGDSVLRVQSSFAGGNPLKANVGEIEYLLNPVGARGDWILLEDSEFLPENTWWAIRVVEKNGKIDFQSMRVSLEEGKTTMSDLTFMESSKHARCELDLVRKLQESDPLDGPGSAQPFLSIPSPDGKHALAIAVTDSQRRAAKELVKGKDGAGWGPFLIAPMGELDRALATYHQFKWLKNRRRAIQDLKSYPKIEKFLSDNKILPPKDRRDATILYLPFVAAMDGAIAGQYPNFGGFADDNFVYHGDAASKTALRKKELGGNILFTRFPIEFTDENNPSTLVHEYMHALDESYFNFSLPATALSVRRALQKKYADTNPQANESERDSWVYYNQPIEKVAHATQIAYLRDVEGLDFQQILSKLNETRIMHSDARDTYSDNQLKLYKQFYEDRNLYNLLRTIRSEASELAGVGANLP